MYRLLLPAMTAISRQVRLRCSSDRGASMVEYGLLVGLIAIVAIVAIETLSGGVTDIFTAAGDEMSCAADDTDC